MRERLNDSWIKKKWKKYMQTSLKIHPNSVSKIDFSSLTKYLKANRPQQGAICKLIHNQLNTFEVCKRWKTSKTHECPLCHAEKEDARHVLSCLHPAISVIREQYILQSKQELGRMQTHPELYAFISKIFDSVISNTSVEEPTVEDNYYSTQIFNLYQTQCNIG